MSPNEHVFLCLELARRADPPADAGYLAVRNQRAWPGGQLLPKKGLRTRQDKLPGPAGDRNVSSRTSPRVPLGSCVSRGRAARCFSRVPGKDPSSTLEWLHHFFATRAHAGLPPPPPPPRQLFALSARPNSLSSLITSVWIASAQQLAMTNFLILH